MDAVMDDFYRICASVSQTDWSCNRRALCRS